MKYSQGGESDIWAVLVITLIILGCFNIGPCSRDCYNPNGPKLSMSTQDAKTP